MSNMPSGLRLETRAQGSPFRETEWDQHLDKMLDDLKTTVHTDVPSRRDNSLTSSFRSTSRSDSRNSNKGVEDAGLMKHHHKEYTSPDKTTRIITDEFEYDTGDPGKAGQYQKKVKKSTYSSYKVHGGISDELDYLRHGPSQSVMDESTPDPKDQINPIPANPTTKISNGFDDMDMIDDGKGGEVRRIVWRNRFDKTCESQDTSTPTLSIEEDAWRQRMKKHEIHTTSSVRHIPPQISPYGGKPWTEPIPLPTPPQLSPGEPGVAYVYTYGQDGGSQLQNLPPLNYVAGSLNSNGVGSPQTDANGKPIVYHYSYHYTLQPGQTPPEGSQRYHLPVSSQPALQVAPPPRHHSHTETVIHSNPTDSYNYQSSRMSSMNRTEKTADENYHTFLNRDGTAKKFPKEYNDASPVLPRRGEMVPTDGQNNLSILINKTTTHTTHTKEYTGLPTSSTPLSDRHGKTIPICTTSYINHSSGNDSLERLKKPYQESKAFPDTSPIQHSSNGNIPRHVEDLMTTFDRERAALKSKKELRFQNNSRIPIDEEGNVRHINYQPYNMSNGPNHPVEHEPLIMTKKAERRDEIEVSETPDVNLKKDETKNLTGPPVYYPPGHQQLFDESMHTMTLKEDRRKGMAKWRREAAMKENSSHKESKGGGKTIVPVCLPLCCGAACTIM